MAQIDQKYIDEGVAWIDKKDLQLYRDITAYNEQALDGRQRMRFSKQIRFGFVLINPLVAGCLFLVILSTEPVIPPAMKWVLPAFFATYFLALKFKVYWLHTLMSAALMYVEKSTYVLTAINLLYTLIIFFCEKKIRKLQGYPEFRKVMIYYQQSNLKCADAHVHVENGAARRVFEAMNREGVQYWSVLSLSQYHQDPLQNLTMLEAKSLEPANCFAFAGLVHPLPGEEKPDYKEQLKLWLDAGFDGLKLIETKPDLAKKSGIRLDRPEFEEMFEYCEQEQIPIIWHVGDPATFWDPAECPAFALEAGWSYTDGSFPPLSALYESAEKVLHRHPKLKVSFAHFYFTGDDPAHAERMLSSYPNVRFDLTPGVEMYGHFSTNREAFRPLIEKYADRICFGTDTEVGENPERSAESAYRNHEAIRHFFSTGESFEAFGMQLHGFNFPPEIQELLFGGSFFRFAGERPRALKQDGVLKACDNTIALLQTRKDPGYEDAVRIREDIANRI